MSAFVVIGIALLLVPMCGGRYESLERIRLHDECLVLVLFLVQGISRGRLVGFGDISIWSISVWAASCLWLLGLLRRDAARPGVPLVMLGLGCNLVVVLLNAGMPASSLPTALESDFYHRLAESAILPILADVLPVPGGALASVGGALLAIGTIILVLSSSALPRIDIQELEPS